MSTILEQLGLDEDFFQWHDLALCRGTKITGPEDDTFYDRYESDPIVARNQDQMCLNCPVIAQCFFAGAESKEEGVWGGVYWDGRGKPDTVKNAHKTPEIWEQIYDKVANK